MIHGEDIKDNENHTVTFKLSNGKTVTKKIVSRIIVKSGIGEKKRLVIFMDIEFHGKKYPNIKFSIGDRNHMSTKVLLGLQFLSKTGMLVDPAEAIYPQNQTKKEECANLGDNTLYEKLTKNGQLKELHNRYEQDDAFERLTKIDQSDTTNNNKIRLSIAYEERCLTRNMQEGAYLARTYIEFLKEIRNSELGSNQPKTDINEDFEFFLLEVSPPKGAARSFSKDEKTKVLCDCMEDAWRRCRTI